MSRNSLDTGNKLMLLQGISLIENGMQFLEWMSDNANENSRDALSILRNRFQYFKECTLDDGTCDYLFIDRANKNLNNVQYGYILNEKLKKELKQLRMVVNDERNKTDK